MMKSEKVALDVANKLIDDYMDMYGYENTIYYLLDIGCTEQDLTELFEFDGDDGFFEIVKQYKKDNR